MDQNTQRQLDDWGGPYVSVATLCEKILNERDGITSVVRICHRLNIPVQPTATPGQVVAPPIDLSLFLDLQAGSARGRTPIIIQEILPSGLRGQENRIDVLFEAEDRGANIVIPHFVILRPMEGLYWFEVRTDIRLLTRVPLRVVFQMQHQTALPSIQDG
ncbi:MAG: hypothetical protein M1396_04580 [Chloroflexi bacterium]|nr:hypothetical protein [Chloroflexota bacterium]